MLFAAAWSLSSRLYSLLQRYAPSNVIIRRVHTRTAIKWGPLIGVAGLVVYGAIMILAVSLLDHDAPGWVNLVVLIAFWDAIKFVVLVPVSLVRFLRVRRQEKVMLHEYERSHTTTARA
jgi:hypothetical protein